MALVRLVVFGFIFLSIIYLALHWYSRSLRREKLEDSWAENHPNDTSSPERDAYITEGMTEYESGLRKKLILLVYIVPIAAIVTILLVTNTN